MITLRQRNLIGKNPNKILCGLKSTNVVVDQSTNVHNRRSKKYPSNPKIQRVNIFFSAIFLDTRWFWVDAHDPDGDGIYTESRTGSPLSFSNWRPGEPNSFTSEKCVYMGTLSKGWNNNQCKETVPILCEHTLI